MIPKNFNEYVNLMKETVTKMGAKAEISTGFKSNGSNVVRLSVLFEGQTRGVSHRISDMFEEYINESDPQAQAELLNKQLEYVRSTPHVPEKLVNKELISKLEHFSSTKDFIVCSVINTQTHQAFLTEIPHVDHLDLSIIFSLDLNDTYQVTITNQMMDSWKVTVKDLWECAKENTVKINGLSLIELPGMIGVTNSNKYKGAGLLFDPHVLHDLSVKYDCDFYIILSSIHEFLLLPVNDESTQNLEDLREYVKVVNRNGEIVSPEDVLSDEIYYYDRDQNSLSFA